MPTALETPERAGRARLVAAFALGIALTSGAVVLVLRPDVVWHRYFAWRWGAVPSNGVVMTLARAPAEVQGAGPGPWLQVTMHNISDQPQTLVFQDPPGDQLGFEVTDAQGALQPPRRQPDEAVVASPLREHALAPGARLAWVVDLTRWVELRGAGPYRVQASRSPILGGERDGHRCRSNAIAVPAVDRSGR